MLPEPSFTVGIEEEYLLIDAESRELAADPPPAFMTDCEHALGNHVTAEFLRCQVEIGTPVCETIDQARKELIHMRGTIGKTALAYGLRPLAVSTHPSADWRRLAHTDKTRYRQLADDLQMVIQRLMICGMHVHVAIEDDDLRIDLFNQARYFLPHLLALTTSSPFWRGKPAGLKSYRLAAFDEMPRTGLPAPFESPGEFERTVAVLIDCGMIEDATKIWWDLRPSARFPTLELRICDVCTRLEDAIAVAALFRCILRMLFRLRLNNQRWRQYPRMLIEENRWLAQRHGTEGRLIDLGRRACVPYADLVDEIITLVREDADFFNCQAAIEHLRLITSEGTSADRQLARYAAAKSDGATEDEALIAVVDGIAEESLAGL